MCLVTGRHAAVARRHPRIRGVRGAQSSGAYLVSFNLDAFQSFGRKQGDNAPVSEAAAFAYATALNTMLAPGSGHNLRIGDTTTVFWAAADHGEANAAAAEDLMAMLLEPPSNGEATVAARDTLAGIAAGRPLGDVRLRWDERTRFHVLGLAPNAARLSVRFWHEDSVGAFARRLASTSVTCASNRQRGVAFPDLEPAVRNGATAQGPRTSPPRSAASSCARYSPARAIRIPCLRP